MVFSEIVLIAMLLRDDSYFIDLAMTHKNGHLSLDFSQTEKQATGPINFVMHDSVPKFMLGLFLTQNRPKYWNERWVSTRNK